MNVHGVNDVSQREIKTTEPPVPEPSAFEVEMAVVKLKLINLKITVRSKTSQTCIGASVTVRRVASLELIQ